MSEGASPHDWNLETLRRGDQNAWRRAFTELWRIATSIVSRRVFSKESVDDLAQETVTAIAKNLNKFTSEGHIRVMTVIIAKRKSAHFLRDQTAGKRDRRREVGLEAAAEIEAAQPEARAAMDLDTMLAQLDPMDRVLLEGHCIGGLKSHELAKTHGLNANTVRGRVKRAMEGLKTKYASSVSLPGIALLFFASVHLARFTSDQGGIVS